MHCDGANPDVRILQEALAYRRRSFSVIPLWPRRKEPALAKGKIVRYRKEAASERTLRRWFAEEERNVGIITGSVSRLLVLDVDGDTGRQSLRGLQMPPTPVVLTGRGHHVYCRHPGGQVGSAIKGMPGVDILAEKRYVVAPSSIHPDGPIYEWHEFLPLTLAYRATPHPRQDSDSLYTCRSASDP
jgi:putative DNA primase/helicase